MKNNFKFKPGDVLKAKTSYYFLVIVLELKFSFSRRDAYKILCVKTTTKKEYYDTIVSKTWLENCYEKL